jgi:hypothetical protein
MVPNRQSALGSAQPQGGKNAAKNSPRSLRAKFWKWFFLIVLIFFIGNLFVQVPRLIGALRNPFPAAPASFANVARLDLERRSGLLLLNVDNDNRLIAAQVATYDPYGKNLAFVQIPTTVSLNLPSEKDNLASLYQSSLDQVFWQTSNLLGTSLEGYLIFRDAAPLDSEQIMKTRGELFSLHFFASAFALRSWLNEHLQTKLTTGQLLSLARVLKGTNPEKISFVDLGETALREGFDQERLQSRLKSAFVDSEIADEALSVQIKNASGVVGLGNSFKQIVTNLGGRVISVETLSDDKTRVVLYSEQTLLAQKMAAFLNVELARGEGEGEGDIVVVLGKDLKERLKLD